MEIKAGEVVSIRHYTGTKLFKSVVLEEDNDVLTVKLIDEDIALLNCSEGDPIVLGFESNNQVYIAGCNISILDKKDSKLVLKVDKVDVLTNKRLSERFPVSFLATIRIGQSQTQHVSVVKNISFTGMMIGCKTDFPLYQELNLTLNIGLAVTIKAIIVRKTKDAFNFEYGLKIKYTDVNTPNLIKKYIVLLKREQAEFIKLNRV